MLHMIKNKKIRINGGGLSGLILSKLLKNNNYEVDLFEKSNIILIN